MKTIDTCGQQHYSPLIPAIKAMCEAGKGEKLEIIMDNATAFNDMKAVSYTHLRAHET